jgi:hypothetical protein
MADTNNYIFQFCKSDKDLKPLIIDTFEQRKFTNFDKYEPLTVEEQNAFIKEYNRNHRPKISLYSRNPLQIEVFQQTKMIYDQRFTF